MAALDAYLNARYRRAVRARGHFPTDKQAALKCLYLVTRSLDPAGRGGARWVTSWKPALTAFAITFEGRLVPSTTNKPIMANYTVDRTLPEGASRPRVRARSTASWRRWAPSLS